MQDRFRVRGWSVYDSGYYDDIQNMLFSEEDNMTLLDAISKGLVNEIIPEQCTGIKDKNEKLIYEGDIVKAVYSDGTGSGFGLPICRHRQCFNVGFNGSDAGWLDEDFIGEVEIIGNIHENSALLGKCE